MARENLEETLQVLKHEIRKIAETNKSLEQEIARLQAVNEIQNLMSKYEYLHTANRHEDVVKLYAKNTPGVRVYHAGLGYWEGKDAPNRATGIVASTNPVGFMAIHPITTPVIIVAGDGKTAKGVWIGIGLVARKDAETGKSQLMSVWNKYGVDFIKEDGKWKFWHFHIYRIFRLPWDKGLEGWNPDAVPMNADIPDHLKPDGPAVEDYPYRLNTKQVLAPVPPEPYETFDEGISY